MERYCTRLLFALLTAISLSAKAEFQNQPLLHKKLAQPIEVTDFDLARDLETVKQIAKEGWATLSTAPCYDENLVKNLFVNGKSSNRPGKKTIIKVARINGKTAGFIIFSPGSFAMVELLAVGSEFRNQGIGYKLLSAAQEIAQQNNSLSLELYVFNHNAPAINLYEKFGFIKSHDAFDNIALMVKPLQLPKQEFRCGTCEKFHYPSLDIKLI